MSKTDSDSCVISYNSVLPLYSTYFIILALKKLDIFISYCVSADMSVLNNTFLGMIVIPSSELDFITLPYMAQNSA